LPASNPEIAVAQADLIRAGLRAGVPVEAKFWRRFFQKGGRLPSPWSVIALRTITLQGFFCGRFTVSAAQVSGPQPIAL
jgi:hypothetical protein